MSENGKDLCQKSYHIKVKKKKKKKISPNWEDDGYLCIQTFFILE